jgi:hypothetical protein
MSRNALSALVVASFVGLLVALAGCSAPQEEVVVDTTLPTTDTGRCPIKVPGTKAVTTEVAQGIVITFTTEDGDVDELRKRVNFLGEEHNKLAARQVPDEGRKMINTADDKMGAPAETTGRKMVQPGDDGAMPVSGRKMMPLATATVEDVDNGAKITLVPTPGTALADLQAHVARRTEAMAGGQCMMPSLAGPSTDEAPATEEAPADEEAAPAE